MSRVEWNDDLSIGIAELDDQHKTLVGMMQDAEVQLGQDPTVEQVYEGILQMMEYARVHFACEETLMAPYANVLSSHAEHVRQHNEFVELALEFMQRARAEGVALGWEVCSFLGTWIQNHIRVMDKAMSKELRALGAL